MLREASACPIATHSLEVNVKNRQHAIDEYHYGPADPSNPEDYWEESAKIWDIETETAKKMMCGNCAAFDVSDRMRKCIEDGIVADDVGNNGIQTIKQADLGYCNLLHFKCAGTRSCSIWLTNGPIVKS
jgi:hypothetical protein